MRSTRRLVAALLAALLFVSPAYAATGDTIGGTLGVAPSYGYVTNLGSLTATVAVSAPGVTLKSCVRNRTTWVTTCTYETERVLKTGESWYFTPVPSFCNVDVTARFTAVPGQASDGSSATLVNRWPYACP